MSETLWYDYHIQFPIAGISRALVLLGIMRSLGFMGGLDHLPDNMLGDKRNADGSIYVPSTDPNAPDTHVFCGRPGQAAFSYTDPIMGEVDVPAIGDPTMMYISVRSPVSPERVLEVQTENNINPADYGLSYADPAVVEALLGVWS